MSEQVKERYHQCINLDCSCTFKTLENITKVDYLPASAGTTAGGSRATE
ncbi:ogr/Delta-like zinc finger family protein [Erwinia rhapontici]